MYLYCVLLVTLFAVGSYADKATCIHNKFNTDIGEQGYRTCHENSGATAIPKIKQCFQNYLKDKEVVITASNGQMTVDRTKFTTLGSSTSSTKVGQAIQACAAKNEDRMYQEVARAVQCVFSEVKKSCK
ncbi:uncharacterized protein CDAR_39471 [Caerostris darwini]|uniref:Uncharacterized protein n=1 Tax=Caerostris darwini TaxID=1538125 RepID=A0AAV4U6B8_9ARAC|nr:uncharacterized protein CDAR_39471 [Caerostris darwini]